MAGKTKGKRAAKKTTAKKSAAKKAPGAKRASRVEVPEETVLKVKKMRDDGKSWAEIMKHFNAKAAFVFRVRPIMKKRWPSSVALLGPGSPNYGKKKKAKK